MEMKRRIAHDLVVIGAAMPASSVPLKQQTAAPMCCCLKRDPGKKGGNSRVSVVTSEYR